MLQHPSVRRAACVLAVVAAVTSVQIAAADQWIEVKSPNFTLMSNAGERSTRKLAWQLEQMRGALKVLWSGMKPDLDKPLSIIVLKDENSMRELAPEYWERRGTVHPASLWFTGPDQHYVAIRTDVEVDDKVTVNPYLSAYFSYGGLVLAQSLDRDLPFWFVRGFTGILSNTIVHDDRILFGPVIPYKLQILRERPRIPLAKLLAVTRGSAEVRQSSFLEVFDAQTWALVHFLMFGDEGKRAPQLSAFIKLVSAGREPAAAFAETLGTVEALDAALMVYVQRSTFAYQRVTVDVSVERERFPSRPVSAADTASAFALFHAARGRGVEGRAAIAAARKADPNAAASYTAEALLFDREDKMAEARAAYTKAVEMGTISAYAHYRLAALTWDAGRSQDTLKQVDALLVKAIDRNVRYADAYAWLGDVRVALGNSDGLGLIRRAISLAPREPAHRLRAASVLLRQGKHAEAKADAQAALSLAQDDEDRREAQELLASIAKAAAGQ